MYQPSYTAQPINAPRPITTDATWVAAVLGLFPQCAGCGRVIRDGEPVTPCDGRNRVVCESCSAQTEATAE